MGLFGSFLVHKKKSGNRPYNALWGRIKKKKGVIADSSLSGKVTLILFSIIVYFSIGSE